MLWATLSTVLSLWLMFIACAAWRLPKRGSVLLAGLAFVMGIQALLIGAIVDLSSLTTPLQQLAIYTLPILKASFLSEYLAEEKRRLRGK